MFLYQQVYFFCKLKTKIEHITFILITIHESAAVDRIAGKALTSHMANPNSIPSTMWFPENY